MGPISELGRTMTDLAAGDTTVGVPVSRYDDEISEMAKTVRVFRETSITRRLAEKDLKQASVIGNLLQLKPSPVVGFSSL